MYLRTIGRHFTQMIAYFLVMNSKRCKTVYKSIFMKIQLKRQKEETSTVIKRMAYVALFLVSPEFKRQYECLVLEDMKMITIM